MVGDSADALTPHALRQLGSSAARGSYGKRTQLYGCGPRPIA